MNLISKSIYIGKHFVSNSRYRSTMLEWIAYKFFGSPEPRILVTADTGKQFSVRHWQNMSELHYWRSISISPDERRAIGLAVEKSELPCVDVGANIGLYSLFFAASGASRVFAIEASLPNYQRLKKNLSENPELADVITPLNVAASDSTQQISVRFNAGSPGQTCITPDSDDAEICETIVLDEFCRAKSISGIALLKIDVEGFEMRVLKGCRELLLEKRINWVLFESIDQGLRNYGSSRSEQWEYFSSCGYQISEVSGQPLGLKDFVESNGTDFLASPRTHSIS